MSDGQKLTHINASGEAHMVDVGDKAETVRVAVAEGFVKMSPLGPAVTEPARKQFDATLAEIMKGGFSVIKGPLKDNKGNVIATAGQAFAETDVALESMSYLVEGVVGSTS